MFRTELNISPSPHKISHQSKILTLGSCFANAIGSRLGRYKFDSITNPFGVIFNPVSIFNIINREFNKQHIIEHDGIWKHFDVHSDLSALDHSTLLNNLDNQSEIIKNRLKEVDILIITFGTAISYQYKVTGKVVANCHKVSSSSFEKLILSPEEIIEAFNQLNLPKNCKVILTVSPVRHLKETIELNSISKSILRYTCHELATQHDNISYFPAFELLMDDLRDYRFYKSDMIHPTEEAEDYIWNKFAQSHISNESLDLIAQLEKLFRAINHKPFHPQSKKHQLFIQETIRQAEMLSQYVNLEKEIDQLK